MTDTNNTNETDASKVDDGDGSQDDPKTFDADYVQKLRSEAAKYRTEAKANADAATELAALKESQKSEAEKLADAKSAAENDAKEARADALRWKTAAKYGISDEDAETFLTGSDEDSLVRQAERLAALARSSDGDTKPGPRPDLSQGARDGKGAAGDPSEAFADFMSGQLNRG